MGQSHSNNHGDNNNNNNQNNTEANRKLSNVSNRNIQLLSIRQRSEKDNYADGLRQRRRSSLINLILGAATSGPRFCDDLCSLNSYLTDYNFGIEYFAPSLSALDNINNAPGAHPYCSRTVSIASTIAHKAGLSSNANLAAEQHNAGGGPGDNNYNYVDPNPDPCGDHHQLQQHHQRRRRRSSVGSFVAHLSNDDDDTCRTGRRAIRGDNAPRSIVRQSSVVSSGAGSCYGPNWPPNAPADAQVPADPATNNKRKAPLMHHASQFASIDLNSSFDKHFFDPSSGHYQQQQYQPAPVKACRSVPLRRCGSELSLYSSSGSLQSHNNSGDYNSKTTPGSPANRLSILCDKNRSHLHSKQLVSNKKSKSAKMSAATTGGGAGSDAAAAAVATTGKETRTIIMLQVCLPFIFAGFGNVAAGLVLNWIAHWNAFKNLPIFFVLLPPFVGLKGNIEMTFASRLSTLSHLNLLDTKSQWRRAYVSNLILMLSQAIGLSLFASVVSILCETLILRHTSAHSHHHAIIFHSTTAASGDNLSKPIVAAAVAEPNAIDHLVKLAFMVVLPSALCTSMILVVLSSFVVSLAICVAKYLRVNPDNFSTLVAALYGDASCVLTYGLVAEIMYRINESNIIIWPLCIVFISLLSWPLLWYIAFRFKETRAIALSSMPAIMGSISISIGSGAILSQVVEKFRLIALYQPVVNGFGANLIAVQASRVSTWLWCAELRKISLNQRQQIPGLDPGGIKNKKLSNSLVSFFGNQQLPSQQQQQQQQPPPSVLDESDNRQTIKDWVIYKLKLFSKSAINLTKLLIKTIKSTVLWSFCNLSPNSIAARLLLLAIIPAHTIYFIVIWLLSARDYVIITWQFYFIYIALCLIQVFILLAICEPLMTLLMSNRWDPDTLGISLLMAMADLVGTLCLAGGFYMLATMGDINATPQA